MHGSLVTASILPAELPEIRVEMETLHLSCNHFHCGLRFKPIYKLQISCLLFGAHGVHMLNSRTFDTESSIEAYLNFTGGIEPNSELIVTPS